jgi:hypothetical protein
LEQNSEVHQYNARRKLDIHVNPLNTELNPICHLLTLLEAYPIFHISRIRVKLQKAEIYKSVINMGTKVYNNLPKFLKEIDNYKVFKKELKTVPLSSNFIRSGRICIFLAIYL